MNFVDCESRISALESVAGLYKVSPSVLDDFLRTFDLDAHYATNDPSRFCDEELRLVFEATFARQPNLIDRVFWFHLTRARRASDFEDGIYPLTASLERVWETIIDVFRGTDHEARLLEMRQRGVPNSHYELKVGKPLLGGPYAMLVRDVAACPSTMGNHDYLRLPEIMRDICNGYQERYAEPIHNALNEALVPIIVKFWSAKKRGPSCIESALYYLYLTAHDRDLNVTQILASMAKTRVFRRHKSSARRSQMPNPSLEWTATGKPLGPRAGVVHHPSRGPSAFPVSAPQLKR